jgi:transformation/transcription domain-associated protein
MELTLPQVGKIIMIYSKDLENPIIPPQIQTMCVKLLIGLCDKLTGLGDKLIDQPTRIEARRHAVQILDVFALRASSLKDTFSTVLKYHNRYKEDDVGNEIFSDPQKIESFIDIGFAQPIRTSQKPLETSSELLKEMKYQFKSVLAGIKSTLIAIRKIDGNDANKLNQQINFSEECEIFVRIFQDGLSCFEYYFVDPECKDKQMAQKDDKDVVEAFALIFTYIDPAMFQETCCAHIPYLFHCIMTNPFILAIPQFFLANNIISPNFSGPLLKYLIEKFEDIGGEDVTKATVMLRLFKLLFMALSLYPEQNERIFQPHIANIIMSSLKVSAKAKEPLNYFLLLRGLFRSIGGGKFESLYQEVIPLLQVLLETLNSLLFCSHVPQRRELFVELCLTVPVRLSVLLPHLSYLMRPLVIALKAGPELVSQSLKTLELCIDNLNQEFLEPIFAPVKDELMESLWQHIKPAPYNSIHSHTTLRILGKFGGRNRKILRDQSPLKSKIPDRAQLNVVINFNGNPDFQQLPLGSAIETANDILKSVANNPSRHNDAFLFIKSCTPLVFDAFNSKSTLAGNILGLIEKYLAEIDNGRNDENEMNVEEPDENPFPEVPNINRESRDSFNHSTTIWLSALFSAAALPNLSTDAWELIESICRHFCLLGIEETLNCPRSQKRSQRQSNEVLSSYASSRLNGFCEALVICFTDEISLKRDVAAKTLSFFRNCCVNLLGSVSATEKLNIFHLLAQRFVSQCYQAVWSTKSGGTFGISILCKKLQFSTDWILLHELDFVKALIYVLKDTMVELPYFDISKAVDTLNHILKVCNDKSASSDLLQESRFNSLVSVLISELSNANKLVRTTVQNSLSLLADLAGKSITDVLSPVGDRLLFPIFAKPLRALPFAMQIGYIEAINFCLSLNPPLITFSDELGRLLHEALALADAEDHAMSAKENQYKNATVLNNLRVECIKLLSSVIGSLDLSSPRISPIKNRILTLFFKCLYSKCPEVIEVANNGI